MRTLLALLAISWIASLASAQDRLLIGAGFDVELFDRATLTTLATRTVGPGPIGAAAVTQDRRYALVAQMDRTGAAGAVAVLDLAGPTLPIVSRFGSGMMVADMTATFDGRRVLVAGTDPTGINPMILVVDATTSPPQAVTTLKLPLSGQFANAIAATPDGKTGYVADVNAHTIHVLDLSGPVVKMTSTMSFSTIGAPGAIGVSGDGLRMLVPLAHVNILLTKRVTVWDLSLPRSPARLPDIQLPSNTDLTNPAFEPGNGFALLTGFATANQSWPNVHVVSAHASPPTVLGSVKIGTGQMSFGPPAVTGDGLTGWIPEGSATVRWIEMDLTKPSAPKPTGRAIAGQKAMGPVLVFGEVHHSGPVWIGGAAVIRVASPVDAGKPYALAAAFATKPGIPLGGGRVLPLSADPLFFASRSLPTIFQGFTGLLNTRGQAIATIAVPSIQALRGLSFYVAGIVADPGLPSGIARVTNAEHIVIQ